MACFVLLLCQNLYWLSVWLKALCIASESKRQIGAVRRCLGYGRVCMKAYKWIRKLCVFKKGISDYDYGNSPVQKCLHQKKRWECSKIQPQIPVKNGLQNQAHTSLFITRRVTFSQCCHQPWNFSSIFCQEMVSCSDEWRGSRRRGPGREARGWLITQKVQGNTDVCRVHEGWLRF